MAELKREYVIPLRRKTRFAPKWRRSKKAVAVVKEFVRHHMKCDNVILCKELNESLWERGSRHPPGKVQVTVLKNEVAGVERVLVNLTSAGVAEQAKLYETVKPQVAKETKAKEEVQEAEVKEVADEKAEEVKETPKKEEAKKAAPKKKEESKK